MFLAHSAARCWAGSGHQLPPRGPPPHHHQLIYGPSAAPRRGRKYALCADRGLSPDPALPQRAVLVPCCSGRYQELPCAAKFRLFSDIQTLPF